MIQHRITYMPIHRNTYIHTNTYMKQHRTRYMVYNRNTLTTQHRNANMIHDTTQHMNTYNKGINI